MNKPIWNVYYHDRNTSQIVSYNVFNHGGIRKDIHQAVKKGKTKEEFADILRDSLMYYYWSKAEWEIVIYPWCGGQNTKEIKVDVFDQVMMNWDLFLEYAWNKRKDIVYQE